MSEVYKCPECQSYYQLSNEADDYIDNVLLKNKMPNVQFVCECDECGIKRKCRAVGEPLVRTPIVYTVNPDEKNPGNLKSFKAEMLVKCENDDPDKCSSVWNVLCAVCGDGKITYLKPKHVPKLIFSPLYDDFANTMKNLFQ